MRSLYLPPTSALKRTMGQGASVRVVFTSIYVVPIVQVHYCQNDPMGISTHIMNKRLVVGAIAAFAVIFNVGYVFHEVVAASFLRAGFGPGVQRSHYIIPVIALAFAIY